MHSIRTLSVICLLLVAAHMDAQTWQWGFRAGSGNTFQPPQTFGADDQVNGIGTDSLGNVYIAGEIFNAPYWGDATIPDINVANRNGSNSYIAKLDCNGALQWVRYIGQNNGFNQGSGTVTDLAVDRAGNCYVYGAAFGLNFQIIDTLVNFNNNLRFFLTKLTTDGDRDWTFISGCGIATQDEPQMAMDDAGNLLVCVLPDTGLFAPGFPITQRYDHYLFKFDTAGAPVWGTVYQPSGGTYSGIARVYDVTMDELSNIYMCGSFFNETQIGTQIINTGITPLSQIPNGFLAKFDSVGNFQWVETAGADLGGAFLAVRSHKERLVVSGSFLKNDTVLGFPISMIGSSLGTDVIVSVDTNRVFLWGLSADSIYAMGNGRRQNLAIDHTGNVYYTYGFRGRHKWNDTTIYAGTTTNGKMELLKIRPDGILDYALTNDGPGSPFDQGSALCVDEQGNVFVGGEFDRIIVFGGDTLDGLASSNTEIFVAKFGLPCAADSTLLGPVPPEGLVATATGSTSVRVTWQDGANFEAGFYLYRSSPDSLNWALVDSTAANTTVYNDTGLAPNTTYWYYAEAFNYVGMSSPTNIDSATTLPAIPNPTVDAPTGLVATAQGPTSILVEWADNANNETGYQIWCSNTGVGNWILVGGTQQDGVAYTDTGLVPNTTYWYRVRAYNATDTSLYSNIDSATTFIVGVRELPADYKAGVYPNPSSGEFVLEISPDGAPSVVEARLVNAMGQLLDERTISTGNSPHRERYELHGLPKGIYFLRLESEGGTKQVSIVVQ